ncbi:hypothetical protein DPEC_G00064310 [Dallia pectoralis]|uniref:Uncharacterized protein n=1 Tax=Dallia pectoralis TaxID=75939 RepID=A0ACC2H7Y7_DALPE|nr:hypothetical protein DPEC_G00064310 [Dallia pectoralis]
MPWRDSPCQRLTDLSSRLADVKMGINACSSTLLANVVQPCPWAIALCDCLRHHRWVTTDQRDGSVTCLLLPTSLEHLSPYKKKLVWQNVSWAGASSARSNCLSGTK